MHKDSRSPGVRRFPLVFPAVCGLLLGVCLVLGDPCPVAAGTPPEAWAEIKALETTFGVPAILIRPQARSYSIAKNKSLTAAKLRGIKLQPDPPQITVFPSYDPRMADGTTSPPYKVPQLRNFRFNYFTNEFNYGGWHMFNAVDYACLHGFDTIFPYTRDPLGITHMPAGTKFMTWPGWEWDPFMTAKSIPLGRWDKLWEIGEANLATQVRDYGFLAGRSGSDWDSCMIDVENWCYSPTELRTQPWYPSSDTEANRIAFEKKYYDGFALSKYVFVTAARAKGFRNISMYGLSPYGKIGWWGLDTDPAQPAGDWFWNLVAKQVTARLDIVNDSVYTYYWSPQNVAYTLAHNDLNLRYMATLPTVQRKPLRCYYENQCIGGNGGVRPPTWAWYFNQPLMNEDMRAMAFMCFFTGANGLVLWNWSGTGNNNIPVDINTEFASLGYCDVHLKDDLVATDQRTGLPVTFHRYDPLHITAINSGVATFQKIIWWDWANNYGCIPANPTYTASVADLQAHTRAPNESLAGLFEGLAMAKVVEYTLAHGRPMLDFDPQLTFKNESVVCRRVRLNEINLVATYDPKALFYGNAPRSVALTNFDGVPGLNVTLPADAQPRLYVLVLKAAA